MVERWLAAVDAGDADAVLARLSEHPGTVFIGTDPTEWWVGDARLVVGRQIEETGGFPMTAEEIHAWEEGSLGWASAKIKVEWGGTTYDVRLTCLLHLEQTWRLEVHPESPIPAASEREHRDSSDNDARRARAGDATRAARPFRLTRSRRHRHDRLHSNRPFDADAFPARRRRLGRGDSAPQHRDRGGHRGARRHRRGDARRRLEAKRSPSARRAVACAREIQSEINRVFAGSSPPIRVRIGIHTGDAIQDANHFFGTTVHYAARVASHAVGGEVLVSSLVRETCRRRLERHFPRWP